MRLSPLIISFWIVGFTKQIIDACAVKPRKFNEHLRRNIVCTHFIFGIARLGHTRIVGNLLLIQIVVCAQIADTTIHHFHHPKTVYLT